MTRFLAQIALYFCVSTAPVAATAEITVFAAASLREVLDAMADAHDGEVRVSYGGSGTMARQVAARAPADVIVLASEVWTDWLVDQNVIDHDAAIPVARNRLVLIGDTAALPLATPSEIFQRLGRGRLAMGQRDVVPAGIYARQWLENSDVWDALRDRLAETDNVRAALALVARQAAPLGIVYATDAQAESRVRVLYTVPTGTHDAIVYSAAALTPDGQAFVDYLAAPHSAQHWRAFGFEPATE